jgi:hypothetical protein
MNVQLSKSSRMKNRPLAIIFLLEVQKLNDRLLNASSNCSVGP